MNGRKVFFPLEKLDKCAVCGRTDLKLRWCMSCAETLYCSNECQTNDWKSHKITCGTTDRIDLQTFYPLLACIAHISHMHPDVPHPALDHKIINSPNPGSGDIVKFPDGTCAKLVILGDKIDVMQYSSAQWWPTALSQQVRSKLYRRIASEGFVLPITLAIAISLVTEIYTTTAIPRSEIPVWQCTDRRRVRLFHNRSPISDFGIAKGSARVTPQDRMAYYNIDENKFMMGQDPHDHYWIYFITLSGEEYFLDCGMMTFNLSMLICGSPYCKYGLPNLEFVPAFFYGQENRRLLPITEFTGWKPRERYSILRDSLIPDVLEPTEYSNRETEVICSLMDRIAGRQCTSLEKELLMKFLPNAAMVLGLNMQNREYLNFPKAPEIVLEKDPGENLDDLPDYEDEAYIKYMKKWSQRYKRGKVTPERLNKAFKAWLDNPHEARMKMAG
ncbi:hypothetical protein BYT27DRAFT_7120907 [Phlegmacium glaucopus]|nr:hypothetical protein BYT27DRAFT_7120907 [Phlegmacium glaucopus]